MLDFPNSPIEGQQYLAEGTIWIFKNGRWIVGSLLDAPDLYVLKTGDTMTGELVMNQTGAIPLEIRFEVPTGKTYDVLASLSAESIFGDNAIWSLYNQDDYTSRAAIVMRYNGGTGTIDLKSDGATVVTVDFDGAFVTTGKQVQVGSGDNWSRLGASYNDGASVFTRNLYGTCEINTGGANLRLGNAGFAQNNFIICRDDSLTSVFSVSSIGSITNAGTVNCGGSANCGVAVTVTGNAPRLELRHSDGNSYRWIAGATYLTAQEIDVNGGLVDELLRLDERGTALSVTYSAVTREKGDARYQSSSRRFKQQIELRDTLSIDILKQLKPSQWLWGGELSENDERWGTRGVGLIAEDVEEVLPEAVRYQWVTDEEGNDTDEKQVMGIDPMAMVAVLVQTVQELTERIEKLEGPVPI